MKGRSANAAASVVGSGISWAARAIVLVVRVPFTRRSRSSSVSHVVAIAAPYALSSNPFFDDRLARPKPDQGGEDECQPSGDEESRPDAGSRRNDAAEQRAQPEAKRD